MTIKTIKLKNLELKLIVINDIGHSVNKLVNLTNQKLLK